MYKRQAHSLEEALAQHHQIGFPTILRPSFTLGGSGGGIAYNREELVEILERGLDLSPTSEVLLEESVLGWKEFEMEVVRDRADNCIIICSIETLDPMGVHTGDSITIAPAQTPVSYTHLDVYKTQHTVQMKFGHPGRNHPVPALDSGRVMISSKNHGFAVDESTLPTTLRTTHRSLFDGSLQGIARTDRPAFSFQGHPEASPGPHDVAPLFDRFIALMAAHAPRS